MNPGRQAHVPPDEQMPEALHGGEHAIEKRLLSERLPEARMGSWEMSGTESQKTMREFEEPEVTEATRLLEIAMDSAVSGRDALTMGISGREEKPARPEYRGSEYIKSPGCG